MVVLTFLLAKATYDYLLDKQRHTAPTHGSGGGVDHNHYHYTIDNNSKSNSTVVMTTAASLPASNTTMSTTTTLVPTPRGHYVMDVKAGLLMLPPEMHRRASNATNAEENDNDAGGIAREKNGNSSNANSNNHPNDAFDDGLRNYSIDYANDSNSTSTTFRNDVRNDWVDAIFGKDYFPIIPSSSTSSNATNDNTTDNGDDTKKSSKGSITSSASSSIVAMNDIAVRQGVGAAGIPHHVTYGAVLQSKDGKLQQSAGGTTTNDTTAPSSTTRSTNNISSTTKATSSSNSTSVPAKTSATATNYSKATSIPSSSSSASSASQQQHFSSKQKLGITITRIPLGLYVHAISIDSEAYAVGISPGSILLDINGTLGLLGERSDRALERLWRYAGLFSGRSGGGGIVGDENYAHNGTTGATTANNNTSSSSSSSGNSLKRSIGSSSKKGDTSNNGGGGCNEHPASTSASSSSSKNNLHVKKPIVLRFYQSGRIYHTTLLSGQPLRGIHWAPCGNFALVHKVLPGSIAAEAGVRRGSLVVGVNNTLGLRSLDHGGVARILRDKFMNGVR